MRPVHPKSSCAPASRAEHRSRYGSGARTVRALEAFRDPRCAQGLVATNRCGAPRAERWGCDRGSPGVANRARRRGCDRVQRCERARARRRGCDRASRSGSGRARRRAGSRASRHGCARARRCGCDRRKRSDCEREARCGSGRVKRDAARPARHSCGWEPRCHRLVGRGARTSEERRHENRRKDCGKEGRRKRRCVERWTRARVATNRVVAEKENSL